MYKSNNSLLGVKMKKLLLLLLSISVLLSISACSANIDDTDDNTLSWAYEGERVLSANEYTNGRIFNTDFNLMAVLNANGNIYITDLDSGEITHTIDTEYENTIMDVVFSEDDNYIVAIVDNSFQVYNLSTCTIMYKLEFNQTVLFAEFINDDANLVVALGDTEYDSICNYNSGIRVSEQVTTIFTYSTDSRTIVNTHTLNSGECIYGITDDDMYICTDGGEYVVSSYSCLTGTAIYGLHDGLYQNASFYPFDENGEYFGYEMLNEDFLDIVCVDDPSIVYSFESENAIYYLGSSQIAYWLDDGTTEIYDFIEDDIVASIPVTESFLSRCVEYNIPDTDKYVGFESNGSFSSKLFVYDLSEDLKYTSMTSYVHHAGMTMMYYLEDKIIFLFGNDYGWNCEIYYYNWD